MAILQLGHLWFWLGLLAIAGVAYTTGLVVYRLFFHPLAKYPGPFLAKLTDAHACYHAWKGDRHLEFWRQHEKYGRTVRFGPNSISINSAEALKDIYGFRANVAKSEFYDAFAHPLPNTHNTRDKEAHARKRRVLSHAFSDGAVKEMERYILANERQFCAEIGRGPTTEKRWTAPKNMADWFSYLAMDILGDLAFGKAFHMLEREDNRYALELVGLAAKRHLICGTWPIVNRLSLDKILFRKISAGRARYMAYSRSQLTERTKLGHDTDRRDFFYHLLRARDPETGQGLSTPELWAESNLFIIAGSDTTATAMAATLFYLTRAPACLAKVVAEVRSTFEDVESIRQGPSLTSLTYLRACIDEALRLSPPAGGLLPREVLPGGVVADGERLPAGVVVGCPIYALHHHPAYYPDPFGFVPERWISGATWPATPSSSSSFSKGDRVVSESDVSCAQSAFCPFSVGPRGCIGKGLAYAEATSTLARLLFLYDVRRPATGAGVEEPSEGGKPGAEWGRHRKGEFQLVDNFTSIKTGPLCEFRERDFVE